MGLCVLGLKNPDSRWSKGDTYMVGRRTGTPSGQLEDSTSRKIEISGRTPRQRKCRTGWRRGLDSNSWLRFAGGSRFVGPQSAYFVYLRQTESPHRRIGQTAQCRTMSVRTKVSFLSSVRTAQSHLLRIVLHVASGFLLGSSMFLDGSLGARACGLSEFGFLLSHEPQLATPVNLAQEIWTRNERREQ